MHFFSFFFSTAVGRPKLWPESVYYVISIAGYSSLSDRYCFPNVWPSVRPSEASQMAIQ
jgi:hypothetical protein